MRCGADFRAWGGLLRGGGLPLWQQDVSIRAAPHHTTHLGALGEAGVTGFCAVGSSEDLGACGLLAIAQVAAQQSRAAGQTGVAISSHALTGSRCWSGRACMWSAGSTAVSVRGHACWAGVLRAAARQIAVPVHIQADVGASGSDIPDILCRCLDEFGRAQLNRLLQAAVGHMQPLSHVETSQRPRPRPLPHPRPPPHASGLQQPASARAHTCRLPPPMSMVSSVSAAGFSSRPLRKFRVTHSNPPSLWPAGRQPVAAGGQRDAGRPEPACARSAGSHCYVRRQLLGSCRRGRWAAG